MPLDFPNSPTGGTTYTGPGGVVWTFDGVKWASGASTTAFAPIVSPVFTGDPTAPTPAYGDNDTSVATTAFVQAAVAPMTHNVGRNRLHNAGFAINQRNYTSGAALAAGVYAHDRWKAGGSGCTYTFTQAQPFTTITVTAGSLQQVIEDRNVEGGTYTLSWTGTAQGRVGAGAYAASPVTVTGLTAGAAVTIEFNTGTLGRVQMEPGSVATPLEKPDPQQDLANCQRFYQTGTAGLAGYNVAAQAIQVIGPLRVTMRAVPTFVNSGISQSNCSGTAASAFGDSGSFAITTTVTATGQGSCYLTYAASADL